MEEYVQGQSLQVLQHDSVRVLQVLQHDSARVRLKELYLPKHDVLERLPVVTLA